MTVDCEGLNEIFRTKEICLIASADEKGGMVDLTDRGQV